MRAFPSAYLTGFPGVNRCADRRADKKGEAGMHNQTAAKTEIPLSRRLSNLVHLDQGGSLRWQHHASTQCVVTVDASR